MPYAMHHGTWFTLVPVMASWLRAPNHYLNQCWQSIEAREHISMKSYLEYNFPLKQTYSKIFAKWSQFCSGVNVIIDQRFLSSLTEAWKKLFAKLDLNLRGIYYIFLLISSFHCSRLFATKPPPEQVLSHHQLDHWKQVWKKFSLKFKYFHWKTQIENVVCKNSATLPRSLFLS